MGGEGTIKITGANLKNNASNNNNSDNSQVNNDYLNNLIDKKIILNEDIGKIDPNATTEIDFMNENIVSSYTQSKAKESTNKTADDFFKGKTSQEIQNQIKAEEEKSKNIDASTFVEIARFIIFLIDASLAFVCRKFSGDATDTAYSLSKPKQEQLVRQLATILIKYQAKFSIEFMFLLSVIILYLPAFSMARDNRKVNKAKKPVIKPQATTVVTPVEEIIPGKNGTTEVKKPKKVKEEKIDTSNINFEEPVIVHQNIETTPVVEETTAVLEPVIVKPENSKRKTRPKKAN